MDSSISKENKCKKSQASAKNTSAKNPRNSSRRSASFSSFSLSSSSSTSSSSSLRSVLYFPEDSPLAPATPLRFTGVPFSWEQLPGIPKNNNNNIILKKNNSKLKKLPLPPPAAASSRKLHRFDQEENPTRKKPSSVDSFRKDPFLAALVECSKDDEDDGDHECSAEDDEDSSNNNYWSGPKVVSRSIRDRFGFINLYTSCKRSCAVSESIVYLPRPTRSSYDLVNRRRSR